MATQTQQLFCFSEVTGTPTNLNAWAGWMSSCLANAGWLQTLDTGQAIFNALTISAVANVSGNTWRYTYATAAGNRTNIGSGSNGLYVGQILNIAALTHSGNNGIFRLVAVTSSTFDVVNVNGQAESGSSGTVTVNATAATLNSNGAPLNTALYEIWQCGDGGSFAFYVKIYYGDVGTNFPGIWVAVGTGTDGIGNLNGNVSQPNIAPTGGTASGSNTANCYFSGDSSRFSFAMWMINGSFSTQYPAIIVIERSHDNTGADTQQYVSNFQLFYSNLRRSQVVFPPGFGTVSSPMAAWATVLPTTATTYAFNGTIGVSAVYPVLGCLGNPLLGAVAILSNDFVDGTTFQIGPYSTLHTYLSLIASSAASPNPNVGLSRVAIRYD